MDVIALYRQAVRLVEQGLTEERIGIRMGLHRLAVCRLLALAGLDEDMSRIFEGERRVSLAALREIASYPASDQSLALADFRRLARGTSRTITRRDVAPILALRIRDLDRDPFPTTSCRACTKRSGVQMDLFGDVPVSFNPRRMSMWH